MKRNYKMCLVRIGSEAVYYSLIKTRIYMPEGVRVLCYHNIKKTNSSDPYTVSIEEFRKQMTLLSEEGYSIISLEDFLKVKRSGGKCSKTVLLTFDDGYKGFHSLAYPILKKYNFPLILFLTTKFVHQGGEYLNWDEVHELYKEDLITIGAHTRSHHMLTKFSINTARREILGSKEEIENTLGIPVKAFSYPYGAYNSFLRNLVKSLGFRVAFTDRFGINSVTTDPFALRRITIFNIDSLSTFNKKLLGAYNWRGFFKKGWSGLGKI